MIFIHINVHFGIGVIIASIFHHIFYFSFLEFTIIVIFSFIMDFDIFFSKYARDHNHRMLITHSIIPSIILLIVGLIFLSPFLLVCALAYFIHALIDTFDWGTNFLGFHKKPWGAKLLITKEELENLDKHLSNFKVKKSFFDFKYYSNKVILFIEISVAFFMLLFIILFALEYIIITLLYIPFLLFHLLGFLHLKRIESH